jgi:hypothetical protein
MIFRGNTQNPCSHGTLFANLLFHFCHLLESCYKRMKRETPQKKTHSPCTKPLSSFNGVCRVRSSFFQWCGEEWAELGETNEKHGWSRCVLVVLFFSMILGSFLE